MNSYPAGGWYEGKRRGGGGGGDFGDLKSHHIELSMSMIKNFEYYFRVITCIQG